MEWTKIPTDLLQSRKSDIEILSITKYQLLWAMLERQPEDEIALRYMTKKQLHQAHDFITAIEQRLNADLKSVISHRNRQKIFYEKNQIDGGKPDAQNAGQCDVQYDSQSASLDKIRIDNIILDKNKEENILNNKLFNIKEEKRKNFHKPTIVEISTYCQERKNGIDAETFFDFYESKGWKVGNTPMKDWKAAIRTWERKNPKPKSTFNMEEWLNEQD